jgi:phosphoribosylaminoimidazolecarboxamide formyltransferase / IMP cyclohydrolase
MTASKQALISVSDKTDIAELATGLASLGFGILSTGGTARILAQAGIKAMEVGAYTGFPEMLDGRVKTLHPKVHGGILARRDVPAHIEALGKAEIATIDIVVVNLYPFAQTIASPNCTLDDAIENIDIGGPTMVRAAAKNYQHVTIVTDPADYAGLLQELRAAGGVTSLATRFRLARKAFSHTAAYDGAISNYLSGLDMQGHRSAFPEQLNLSMTKVQDLRYGENPHQAAAFYRDLEPAHGALANYVQLQGKELSYNNIGGLRDRQTRQSVRSCGREKSARCLRTSLQDRPDIGLRWHHRLQPGAGQNRSRSCRSAVCRGGHRSEGEPRSA